MNRKQLKFSIIISFLAGSIIVGCKTSGTATEVKDCQWEGKWVTKKQYDSLLYSFTEEFIKNYIPVYPADSVFLK